MPTPVEPPLSGPFTVDDYYRLAELGILDEDSRVELLDGVILSMTPIGPGHGGTVNALHELLRGAVGTEATLSVQNPLRLSSRSEPEPDVAILRRHPTDPHYRKAHPSGRDVLLLVEVTDSSWAKDRNIKIPLYARSGIPEVWLVDLRAELVEMHRQPEGGAYARVNLARRGDTISPSLLPDVHVSVAEILG